MDIVTNFLSELVYIFSFLNFFLFLSPFYLVLVGKTVDAPPLIPQRHISVDGGFCRAQMYVNLSSSPGEERGGRRGVGGRRGRVVVIRIRNIF